MATNTTDVTTLRKLFKIIIKRTVELAVIEMDTFENVMYKPRYSKKFKESVGITQSQMQKIWKGHDFYRAELAVEAEKRELYPELLKDLI